MRIFLFVVLAFVSISSFGQSQNIGGHKIVFQMTSNDTLSHKALMKQLGNLLTLSPGSQLEVVCHGPGLNMLVERSSVVSKKVSDYSAKGVVFMACQFSMNERKVVPEDLHVKAQIIPGGIIEIVEKQEQGWSYIKAGN